MTLHLPREHDAWVQFGFTLTCALLLGHFDPAAVAIAAAALIAFWAHEPLAVVLGYRGPALRDAHAKDATRLLLMLGTAFVVLLAFAAVQMDPSKLVALHPPIVTGTFLMVIVAAKQERTTLGGLMAATATASWGVPVAVAGGVTAAIALEVWLAFTVSFAMGTLAVRAVIQSALPSASRKLRVSAVGVATFCVAALFMMRAGGSLHPAIPWAVVPAAMFAVHLAVRPPNPKQLRRVAWEVAFAGLVGTTVLVAALR